MRVWLNTVWEKLFGGARTEPDQNHLKAKTEVSLSKSLKQLMPGQAGYITFAEAGRLFSANEDDPLGEGDVEGIAALGRFAGRQDHRSALTRNTGERRIYFTRF